MGEKIVFGILAVLMVVLAIMTVTTKKTLRSAIYLLFVLLGTAGIYLLLNYHFLAVTQVAVYAGGVVVLFVFAILLVNPKTDETLQSPSKGKIFTGLLTSLGGIAVILFTLWKVNFLYAGNPTVIGDQEIDMKLIGWALLGTGKHGYLLPFELLSILLLACIMGGILIARKR